MAGRAFDPGSPGAARLAAMHRGISRGLVPVQIRALRPILLVDGVPRRLSPGDVVAVPARVAERFVGDGSAVYERREQPR
jgi:hypothetical protein